MVVRKLVLAGLCATATLAQAGPLDSSNTPASPNPTAMSMSASPAASTWSTYSRRGDRGGASTALFNGSIPGIARATPVAMPAQADLVLPAQANPPAPAAPVVAAPAPVPAPVAAVPAPVIAPAPVAAPAPAEAPVIAAEPAPSVPVSAPPAAEILGAVNAPPAVNAPTANLPVVNAPAPAQVPEPATGLLMLAGLVGAGVFARRRK